MEYQMLIGNEQRAYTLMFHRALLYRMPLETASSIGDTLYDSKAEATSTSDIFTSNLFLIEVALLQFS